MLANPSRRKDDRRIHLLYADRPLAVDSWTLVIYMPRNLSNMCFGAALSGSLVMKLFEVRDELIWLAIFSVAVSAILTNFMWIRSMGIAGVGGLSIVYFKLGNSSLPGAILTILTTALLVIAVFLSISADSSHPVKVTKETKKKNEA